MNRVYRLVFNRAKGVCQAVSETAATSSGGSPGTAAAAAAATALPGMSALASACVLALASWSAGSAWAGGGAGGSGYTGGTGGAGGTLGQPVGVNGGTESVDGYVMGGGGGGGAASTATLGDGASGGSGGSASGFSGAGGAGGTAARRITGTAATTLSTTLTGGGGAAGGGATAAGPEGYVDGGGGGGGGGAAGVVSSTTGTVTVSAGVTGGAGGQGGAAGPMVGGDWGWGGAGGGGQGGSGLVSTAGGGVTVNATRSVSGGRGGDGGSAALGSGGAGGAGGAGVEISGSRTLTNLGTIRGGAGGAGGVSSQGTVPQSLAGAGGVAIKASGGVTVVNSGVIAGGMSGTGAGGGVQADAIQFGGGGTNTLSLVAGSAITGNVVATMGGSDRLILGGTVAASFDASAIGDAAQYRNFAQFQKTGTGTWTLTGATSALTPWSILGGTLSIAQDASLGASAGTLTLNGGSLLTTASFASGRAAVMGASGGIFNTAADTALAWGGVISGTGRLTKQGAGTLVLTAGNTYSGNTTVSAGTLQIGDGGSTGSIAGTVTNNGALAFKRSDVFTFSNAISGTGAVNQIGSGTTVLTGTSTYSGVTTISAGTLQIGNGTTGSIGAVGAVLNNGTLAFNRSNSLTFANAISGSGGVVQRGTGAVTLSGANSYTGTTSFLAGTVTVAGDGNLGNGGGLVFNGGTLAASGSFGTNRSVFLDAGGGTLSNGAATALTLSGTIDGSGRLTKSGAGTTILAGTNSYAGGTTVSAGTLSIAQDASLGASAGTLTLNGGSLLTTAGFASGRAAVMGASGGIFNTAADTALAWGGVISGTGRLTKQGAGTLVLTAGNTYSGNTTVSAGTLQIGDGGSTGSIAGTVTNNGALAFKRSDVLTFSNAISGTGAVNQIGSGTTVLTGTSTYSGVTTISAGTLQIGNGTTGSITGSVVNGGALVFNRSNTTSYAGSISGSGSVTQAGGATLTLSGTSSYTGSTTISAGALTVSRDANLGDGGALVFAGGSLNTTGTFGTARAYQLATNGTVNTAAGTTLTLSGLVSGGGRLTKAGSGVLALAGNETYSGGTVISAGTLQIGAGGTTGSIVGGVANSGVLAFNRSDTASFGGVISGSGSVAQIGSGKTVLTAVNTYTGGTTVSAGVLAISQNAQLGAASGRLTLSGGGTLNTTQTASVARAVTLGAGGGVFNTDAATTLTLSGVVSGTGGLGKSGGGTLLLSGVNTYTGGTTISGGTLSVSQNGNLGNAAGSVGIDGGTLNATASIDASARALSLGAGGGTVNTNGNTVTFGAGQSGSGALTKLGSGVLVLAGSDNHAGGTTVSAGTLQIGRAVSAGSLAGNVANGGSVVFMNTAAPVAGTISGSGSVTKTGSGTTVLTGASTYSGATAVLGGTLQVDGALGNTAVTVASTAALGGAGSIAGAVSVANGGTLQGRSGQTLATGALTLGSGSIVDASLGTAGGPALFQVNGALTLDGQVNVSDIGGFGAGVYRLFNYTGALTDNGLQIGQAPNGAALSVQTAVARQVNLVNTAGQSLLFWDGSSPANLNNNVVDGGPGTWKAVGTDWANQDGSINAAMTPNAGFAVFQAAPGTVTVDNSQGAVAVTGMQFATDGYVVQGAPIQLAAAQSIIRVGDGSATPVSATVGTTLAGTARLEKTGSGTLVLTGANSYTEGTLISGGTLQLGNGGTGGTILGDVTNNGTLAFNRSDAATFSGAITGSGGVRQSGAGTIVLTNGNTYGGGTVIAAGTLQLGNGGLTGSITGDVMNDGTLAFKRSDAVDFAGVISGSGAVQQIGGGTTTLGGVNSYSGGTRITAGTLVGSATSFGTGPIVNDAALEIRQPSDASFANAMSGSGSFVKSGAGALNLTGDSSAFGGVTRVTAGTLAVNGALGGTLTMASGSTLKGNGTIGTTVVQSGATLAPGNSIGTLHVAGDLTLATGSTYQVEAAADGRSDLVRATGAIRLQGGTLAILADGNWNPTATYKILDAGSAVSGSFGGVTTNFAFLDPTVAYSAQNVVLSLKRNDTPFEAVAGTPNESQVGGAVDASGSGALYNAVVQLDAVGARNAFAQLGGELHASLKSMAIEDSRYVRDAGLDHARRSLGGVATGSDTAFKDGVWAYGYGARGDIRGDGNASKVDGSTSGLLIGGDTRVGDDWRVGAMAGYSSGSVDLDARASSASSDGWHLGVYGGRQWGAMGLRLGASYSDASIDTRRTVLFGGFADLPTASYKAQTAQVFGELGWRIDAGAAAVEPFAGLAYVHLHTDDFAERGGFAALSGASGNTDIGYSTLGVRASTGIDVGGTKTTLRGMLGWRHAIGSTDAYTSLALAAQPAFAIAGVPIAKDVAVIEAGVDFSLRRDLTLGVSYIGQAGDGVTDNGIKASLLWKF